MSNVRHGSGVVATTANPFFFKVIPALTLLFILSACVPVGLDPYLMRYSSSSFPGGTTHGITHPDELVSWYMVGLKVTFE
jgi:hypothetical protein